MFVDRDLSVFQTVLKVYALLESGELNLSKNFSPSGRSLRSRGPVKIRALGEIFRREFFQTVSKSFVQYCRPVYISDFLFY